MAFLIVVGLFVTYETLYDHIVDREQNNSGLAYMLIHVFLIFAMNNITSALEFMREDEIDIMPKMLFLVGSLLLFFVCIFLLGRYAKKRCRVNKKLIAVMAVSAVCFSVLMILLREYMKINILLTVAYVFGVFVTIHIFGRQQKQENKK
jgi:FtsH-binding integral membrane protein